MALITKPSLESWTYSKLRDSFPVSETNRLLNLHYIQIDLLSIWNFHHGIWSSSFNWNIFHQRSLWLINTARQRDREQWILLICYAELFRPGVGTWSGVRYWEVFAKSFLFSIHVINASHTCSRLLSHSLSRSGTVWMSHKGWFALSISRL